MSIKVGDTVFMRDAMPAQVIGRDKDTGQLKLEVGYTETMKSARHGFINGMGQDQQVRFKQIMDEVGEKKDPKERAADLFSKINELEMNPKNFQLSRYLNAEYQHLINTFGIKPREYTIHNSQIR
jgi:hypothetical protein